MRTYIKYTFLCHRKGKKYSDYITFTSWENNKRLIISYYAGINFHNLFTVSCFIIWVEGETQITGNMT